MYKSFSSLEELFEHLKADKEWTGANAAQHNRYPMRFILFDNFADFNEFIVNRPDGIFKYCINTMLDAEYPDSFLTYTELSSDIRRFAKMVPINDFVIFPFSEIARFYDHNEFDSLVTTVRGTQAPEDAQNAQVRLYIPIVGMQGKMGKFITDNTTFVWEYKSGAERGTYNLVLTDGSTYGVSGLDTKYSVVNSLSEWLCLWEKGEGVRRTIICSSPNIFTNAHYAQPDNAFTYQICENVYQFLTKALGLDFGVTDQPSNEELPLWEQLAKQIDINSFNFDDFVKARLDIYLLQDGIDFIKSWLNCDTEFDRWLLTTYFKKIAPRNSYILRVVSECGSQSKSDLFSKIATLIFDLPNKDEYQSERLRVMTLAAEHGVTITDEARRKLKGKLAAIAATPESGGHYSAVKLLTPLTDEERQLCTEWLARGMINVRDIKNVFRQLYNYLSPLAINGLNATQKWIEDYFDAYRKSKISNTIDSRVREIMSEKNATPTTFYGWRDSFKTVKTILNKREDIDVYYWIDGLGIDWIPFIREIVSRYAKEHVYLNEIHIAVADLPTTTSVNKDKLQGLLPDGMVLPKIGDLDNYAHSAKSYPQYIIDELAIVERAITSVLDDYNGNKIAFVSDHGLTYLAQHEPGLKLGGIIANHEGRTAIAENSAIAMDDNYLVLDDGISICSLTHRSLVDKVYKGHGAHGGCTPEEVLVPIIIVSSQKNANNFTVKLLADEVSATNPVLHFEIKGLSTIDVPSIKYNGVEYSLSGEGKNFYKSERLNLVDTATKVNVLINGQSYSYFGIKVSTGAQEEDLFG